MSILPVLHSDKWDYDLSLLQGMVLGTLASLSYYNILGEISWSYGVSIGFSLGISIWKNFGGLAELPAWVLADVSQSKLAAQGDKADFKKVA